VDGTKATGPRLPPRELVREVGPCFRLASREPGVAGLGVFAVQTRWQDRGRGLSFEEHEMLVTSVPSALAPARLGVEEFRQAAAFDLQCDERHLGTVPGCPRAAVTFNGEGAFQVPPDADWAVLSPHEEDLLQQKLLELCQAE
jgi:hypothetical protein